MPKAIPNNRATPYIARNAVFSSRNSYAPCMYQCVLRYHSSAGDCTYLVARVPIGIYLLISSAISSERDELADSVVLLSVDLLILTVIETGVELGSRGKRLMVTEAGHGARKASLSTRSLYDYSEEKLRKQYQSRKRIRRGWGGRGVGVEHR